MFLSLEANGASDKLRVIRKATAVVNPIRVACFFCIEVPDELKGNSEASPPI